MEDAGQGAFMSYVLEEFVARIESPVICRVEGRESKYRNGEDLARTRFDRPYFVSAITAGTDAVILELMENTRVNETAWAGEKRMTFF